MVFSSLPLYLDPPNWQQHLNQNHQQTNGNNEDSQLLQHQHQPPQLVPVQPSNHLAGGGGSGGGNNTTNPATFIRPNSMTERARLAKIPQPDAPLKCPRCESTNTKFCYYNNYSLTQPRHFCKTCRRYWTRGGALRSVPVGGGCRRNKRSKSINSKSNTSSNGNIGNTGTAGTPTSGGGMMMNDNKYNSSGPVDSLSGHLSATPQLSFMASLQNMTQLGMGNLGLSFPGIQLPSHHQLENNRTSSTNNSHHMSQFGTTAPSSSPLLTSMQLQQETHHQFPFMAGFHDQVAPAAAAGLYPFHQNEDVDVDGGGENHELMMMMGNCKGSTSTTSSSAGAGSTHNAPVKMEENFHKKLLLGMSAADDQNNQFWYSTENGGAVGGRTANMWTDLSGLNSSSATHLL